MKRNLLLCWEHRDRNSVSTPSLNEWNQWFNTAVDQILIFNEWNSSLVGEKKKTVDNTWKDFVRVPLKDLLGPSFFNCNMTPSEGFDISKNGHTSTNGQMDIP